MPHIPIIEVKKETFGYDFYPPDLISSNLERRAAAKKAVVAKINVAKIMTKENKDLLTTLTFFCLR